MTSRIRQAAEQNRHHKSGQLGKAERETLNWTNRTGQVELNKPPRQGCQDKTDRVGQPGEDRKERTAGTG
jgi:hypothetical protein